MPDSIERLHGWNAVPTGPLVAGPLLGEVSTTEARIWVQGRSSVPLQLRIHRDDATDRADPEQILEQTPEPQQWLCAVFHVHGLDPSGSYSYSFLSENGETERTPLRLGIAEDATALRIVFGSCYKEYTRRDQRIFDSIAETEADLVLMLGDWCYTDEHGSPRV